MPDAPNDSTETHRAGSTASAASPLEIRGSGKFHTTQWTGILAARGTSAQARDALSELCANYYEPVLAFLRRDTAGQEDPRELAHEFFESILTGHAFDRLERGHGKFRSYLLGALKHFLAHRRERHGRQRRGGNAEHVPIHEPSDTSPDLPLPDPRALPDAWFDQLWATALLDRALARLQAEWDSAGSTPRFDDLKPWLTGDTDHGEQARLSARLGTTPAALKSAVHRAKLRFRQLVRLNVAETLANPADTDAEMTALFAALSNLQYVHIPHQRQ